MHITRRVSLLGEKNSFVLRKFWMSAEICYNVQIIHWLNNCCKQTVKKKKKLATNGIVELWISLTYTHNMIKMSNTSVCCCHVWTKDEPSRNVYMTNLQLRRLITNWHTRCLRMSGTDRQTDRQTEGKHSCFCLSVCFDLYRQTNRQTHRRKAFLSLAVCLDLCRLTSA